MRIIKVLSVLIAGLATLVLLAQSDADYQGWMKQVVANNGKLQKGIAAKDASVTAEAATLESVFKQVEGFWQKRNVTDAANFAKQAHMAAAAAGKAVSAGDFDKAAAEGKNLTATCAGCHGAHREKGDNGFKIK